jgi:hypothetical protein
MESVPPSTREGNPLSKNGLKRVTWIIPCDRYDGQVLTRSHSDLDM